MTTQPSLPPLQSGSIRLEGVFTALVTPFSADGELDRPCFTNLVGRQLAAGVSGVVPVGTTGESPTLSPDEREWLIECCVRAARADGGRSRPTVLAGTGTNSTAATVRATRRAAELGADAALVVLPYYNRPNQAMLEAHFLAVAEDGDLPIVLYNVPSRTASNLEPDTLLRLAEHPRIIGVKEASGNLDQLAVILANRPRGFAVLAGDDLWTLPLLAMGGDGVVSVAGNEVPERMVALCTAALGGDWLQARRIQTSLLELFRANFTGAPNPAPVKAALALMGLGDDHLRLPLQPLDDGHRDTLASVLTRLGVLAPAADAVPA